MKSHVTATFLRRFADLPPAVQTRARDDYRVFQRDPNYPGLNFHSVTRGNEKLYSVYIGIHYRASGRTRRRTVLVLDRPSCHLRRYSRGPMIRPRHGSRPCWRWETPTLRRLRCLNASTASSKRPSVSTDTARWLCGSRWRARGRRISSQWAWYRGGHHPPRACRAASSAAPTAGRGAHRPTR